MGEKTGIQWCDHTFSPWIGCSKVSQGCAHCYAEVDNPARIARGQGLELWGVNAARKAKADSGWREPEKWFRKAVRDGVRRRVFCASQCDVFEDRRDLDVHRERLWNLVEFTGHGCTCSPTHGRPGIAPICRICHDSRGGLDWLLLTKRPEHIMRLIPERWRAGLPPNVWVGTSVEDQAAADERIPHLLRVPARVRFLSCEPLLGPVNLRGIRAPFDAVHTGTTKNAFVDWIIIGGESGPKARPCDIAWVRDLVVQCRAAGVAPFVKQLGAMPCTDHRARWVRDLVVQCRAAGVAPSEAQTLHGVVSAGVCWKPIRLKDSHGGDPAEWPADLRDERHFPIVRHLGAPEPPPLSHHVEEALGP